MSAYVNRLIQRFGSERSADAATMNPSVHSRSPIAAVDQRLGVDEALGHGLSGLEPEFQDSEGDVDLAGVARPRVEPRIQRKTISSPAAAPALASTLASPVAPTPTPAGPVSPAGTPADPGPQSSGSEPLDPGSLFDPTPRYFDELPVPMTAEPAPSVARVETLAEPPTLAAATTSAATPDIGPKPRSSSGDTQVTILLPGEPAPTPWRPYSSRSTNAALALRPQAAALEPSSRPTSPAPAPSPTPQLYIVPRPPASAPFIPEPAPVATPTPAASTPETRGARPEAAARPPRAPQPGPAATNNGSAQKLTIDSISQIGPLDRHFSNRRSLRLRFR